MNTKKEIARFLAEDINKGDVTSRILTNKKITAKILARQDGVVAGVVVAKQVFLSKGCRVKIIKKDGSAIKSGQTALIVFGLARNVLSCERTALNLLSRMSGIATQTSELVRLVKSVNSKSHLYSTRKTAPGLRYFDKEAVAIGGGKRHRMTLSDMIMIKDNHIAAEGSLIKLIQRAKKQGKKFEVEVETPSDAILAARLGTPIIMLDNFTPQQIQKTITNLKKLGLRNKVVLEASGGINHSNIKQYAKCNVDMISVGSITNSVKAVDFSLEIA